MTYKQMEGACSEGENPRQDAETLIGSLFFPRKILTPLWKRANTKL